MFNTIKNFINKISINIISVCFTVFSFVYLLINTLFTANLYHGQVSYQYFSLTSLFVITVILLFIILAIKLKDKINDKFLIKLVLFILAMYGIFMISCMENVIWKYADSYTLVEIALEMVNGNFQGVAYKSYINVYPHQVGILTYFFVLAKIFSDNFITIARYINLLLILLGLYHIYKISDYLFKNKTINIIGSILMLMLFQYINLSFEVYSYCISFNFIIIATYYFIKYYFEKKIILISISSILISIAMIIIPSTLIACIAIVIFLSLMVISSKSAYKGILVFLISMIISFGTTSLLQDFYSSKGETTYDKALPAEAWLAYGFNYNPTTPGMHFGDINQFFIDSDLNEKLTSEMAIKYIKTTIDAFKENPYYLFKFVAQKLSVSYAMPDYGTLEHFKFAPDDVNSTYSSFVRGDLRKVTYHFWDGVFILFGVGLIMFCYFYKDKEIIKYFIPTIVFGSFIYYIVSEIQGRYMLLYIMLLIPYASYGIFKLCEQFKKLEVK